jgi:uncharacterized membrane protein YeaQ/YmgE (transglycosylase-associated protein family)
VQESLAIFALWRYLVKRHYNLSTVFSQSAWVRIREDYMPVFLSILANDPVITGNILGFHFVVTQTDLFYWLVAAIVGVVAEIIVGWRLPLGFLGAFLAALAGIWLVTNILKVSINPDPIIGGVPIYKSLLGASITVFVWHLLTFRSWKRPRRSRPF